VWLPLIAAVGALVLSLGTDARLQADSAWREFQLRVGEYVALHRVLEGPRARTLLGGTSRVLYLGKAALADEIRRARPLARQGDVIVPDMADAFRRMIRDAVARGEITGILQAQDEATATPSINANLPGDTIPVPPCLVRLFPPVPEELEYRFLGRHLILFDVHADIVVDYVPDVLPRLTWPA
jgi:hypothetical protein